MKNPWYNNECLISLRCDMSQVKLVSSTSSNTQFISPFSPVMFLTSVPSLGKAAFKADKSSEAQVHPVPHLKRLLIGHKHWSTPKKRAGMVVFGGSIAVQHLIHIHFERSSAMARYQNETTAK